MKPEVAKKLARGYEGLQNIIVGRIVKACDKTDSLRVKSALTDYLGAIKVCNTGPENEVAAENCQNALEILANEMGNECIWEI